MTLKGHNQLPEMNQEDLAILFYACVKLHPANIGKKYGVHAQYVRQQFRERDPSEYRKRLMECLARYFDSLHL